MTRKGQGYKLAEADPVLYHGVCEVRAGGRHRRRQAPAASRRTRRCSATGCATWRRSDPRLVGDHPGDARGLGPRRRSRERFPERYFDVGIAEQHAVTFAAGLACEGMKPVVAIYSTFLQRAYDQFIHDVAIQNLPVLFALDRAGLVGADGATHHGAFDLAYLRCVPEHDGDGARRRERVPADALHRLPARRAGRGPLSARQRARASRSRRRCARCRSARAEVRREGGRRVAILAFGTVLKPALEAGEELDATVVNMRFVKPLDDRARRSSSRARTTLLVTVEENVVMGGAGSAVAESIAAAGRRGADPAPRPAGPLHRSRRPEPAARARRARQGRHPRVDRKRLAEATPVSSIRAA